MFSKFSRDPVFLTLTYSRQTHNMEAIEHFYADYPIIRKKLLTAQACSQYGIWCELTDAGQLHWHIIVEPKDNIKFKINCGWWAKHRGFINTKPVTNLDTLMNQYLEKERIDMEAYLFRGLLRPTFPLREFLDPSVICTQEELYINEKTLAKRKKAVIQDLKNFQYYGKQIDKVNYMIPPID